LPCRFPRIQFPATCATLLSFRSLPLSVETLRARQFRAGFMKVEVHPSRGAAGRAAARALAQLAGDRRTVAVIFATGASQFETLAALTDMDDLPWDRMRWNGASRSGRDAVISKGRCPESGKTPTASCRAHCECCLHNFSWRWSNCTNRLTSPTRSSCASPAILKHAGG
jgi:hypothetical protein